MKLSCLHIITVMLLLACQNQRPSEQTAQTSDPCNSPDADIACCFKHAPSKLSHIMTIDSPIESADKLHITGTISHEKTDQPYAGVIIYAYHTDNEGIYSKSGKEQGVQRWHGQHHGWCMTDAQGRYEIRSIRPARYPTDNIPAHIHLAIQLPDGSVPFYINDIVFADDDLIDENYISSLYYEVGGDGVVDVVQEGDTWVGVRDMRF